MVVVTAFAEWNPDGSPDHHVEIHPVLALVARQQHEYRSRRRGGDTPNDSPIHERMEQQGWIYCTWSARLVDFDAAVYSGGDFGVCLASEIFDCEGLVHELVPTPWPESEDPERLKDIVQRVIAEAVRCSPERKDRQPQAATVEETP
jgi:hypothetical protein